MMRHAFLVQVHEDPDHLPRLVRALAAPWVHVFIHIDAKSAQAAFEQALAAGGFEQLCFVRRRVEVYWGGWSQVQAALNPIGAALDSGVAFSHFTLPSGVHFPLVPPRRMAELLDAGTAST
jgi:hypothetical protein